MDVYSAPCSDFIVGLIIQPIPAKNRPTMRAKKISGTDLDTASIPLDGIESGPSPSRSTIARLESPMKANVAIENRKDAASLRKPEPLVMRKEIRSISTETGMAPNHNAWPAYSSVSDIKSTLTGCASVWKHP